MSMLELRKYWPRVGPTGAAPTDGDVTVRSHPKRIYDKWGDVIGVEPVRPCDIGISGEFMFADGCKASGDRDQHGDWHWLDIWQPEEETN